MNKIKFGTDGWRAIIAKDYTTENVARVTIAVSQWLNEKYDKPSVIILNEDLAITRKGGNVAAHEFLHFYLNKTVIF